MMLEQLNVLTEREPAVTTADSGTGAHDSASTITGSMNGPSHHADRSNGNRDRFEQEERSQFARMNEAERELNAASQEERLSLEEGTAECNRLPLTPRR